MYWDHLVYDILWYFCMQKNLHVPKIQREKDKWMRADLCAYIENTIRLMTIFSWGEPLQSPRIWEICFWPRYFRRNTVTMQNKILVKTSLKKYKKVPLYVCHENEWLWFVVSFEGSNMKRWKKFPISDTFRGLSLVWTTCLLSWGLNLQIITSILTWGLSLAKSEDLPCIAKINLHRCTSNGYLDSH